MKKKLLLVDGHSILNRAFYGIRELTNSKGLHTNAIYGFLNTVLNIMDEEKPDFMFVAFDVKEKTFRHKAFAEYKGQRKPMPQELHEQVPVMKDVLKSMNIKTIELPGFEADDVIGTLSKRAEKEGLLVTVLSGDRDLLQLATDDILIRIPKTKAGGTEVENYHTKEVIAKVGVSPLEYIDVKALMGDSSDNIPGVPGIGEKTATSIIQKYKSLENAIEHIDEITPPKAKNNLSENIELAKLCKFLATINTDAPVNVTIEDGAIGKLFNENSYEMMVSLEFKKLIERFKKSMDSEEIPVKKQEINCKINEIKSKEDLDNLVFSLMMEDKIGISFEKDKQIASFATNDDEYSRLEINENIDLAYVSDAIIKILNNNATKCLINLKELLKSINAETTDIVNRKSVYDLSVGAYLLNPLKDSYNFDDIARDYLDLLIEPNYELNGYGAVICFKAFEGLTKKIEESQMIKLYEDIEMPIIYVLYDMERIGIRADAEALKEYGEKLKASIESLEQDIYAELGSEINLNSPKQLGEKLFGEMGIPGGKKTKTGYSTSADVLEKLAPEYPFIKKILEYRTLAKLKSTYADGLAAFIMDDGRIHGKFNQTITATGRISSTEPNLQNIPIRMEIGRELRKIFIPKENHVFIDADYSQIELRVLAHISGDETLIEAYKSDQDIHRITASKVFNTPLEEVTSTQRSNAKAVNFGIVYGISSFGLSQDIGISRKQAKEYIEQYFETYPGIKSFLDKQVNDAKENGYVKTMFNRLRPIPEIKSSNFMQRSFGERVAMNSPIQGTAADIIKIAMINVSNRLFKENMKSKLILQVHDELLVEAPKDEAKKAREILIEEMERAANLKVQLVVEANIGNNWLEAH